MDKKLEDYVITIPDFPKPGIMFRDITGILRSADGFKLAIDELIKRLEGVEFDTIAVAEARGFILGSPVAYELGKKLALVRKKGKLPRETVQKSYELEYGSAVIEMHKDSISEGERVVIIDDLIATGGTVKASQELIEQLGGKVVKILFVIELEGLNGRALFDGIDVESIIKYPGK